MDRERSRTAWNRQENLVLLLIRKGIECEGEQSSSRSYEDLDSLAGTWTEEQSAEFVDAISFFEQVDEKLWQ
jgi:hypothetical protein